MVKKERFRIFLATVVFTRLGDGYFILKASFRSGVKTSRFFRGPLPLCLMGSGVTFRTSKRG